MNPRTIVIPKEDAGRRQARMQRISTFLSGLAIEKPWELIVRPFKRTRTNPQNAYERGVACVMIATAIGWKPDDVHDHLCGAHWGWKDVPCPPNPRNPAGFKSEPIRTTTTDQYGERDVLEKRDYWDFVEFIQRFGAEHGVMIPDPDPDYAARREMQHVA